MNFTQNKSDPLIPIITVFLSLFGILMIYSASSYGANIAYGDSFFYVKKQAISFAAGLVVMFGMKYFDLSKLVKLRYLILVVSLVLLALVFVPGLSYSNYGATRWINLGFTTIQPSELSKFGFILFAAAEMSVKDMRKFKNTFPVFLAGGAMCGLIMAEPNMSITMCVGIVMIIMLFVGGMKLKTMLMLALPIIVGVILLIVLEPYRMKRLTAFLDPWASPKAEGYQLIQSYYALGSGGFFGVGLFHSRQKYLFLPFSESDFIFSIVGEELGLLGAAFVIILFVILTVRIVKSALRAENRFYAYLSAGIAALIAVQTAINIAVVSGSIPPTGLPLPFMSAGGSALLSYMAAIGLTMNVSAHKNPLGNFGDSGLVGSFRIKKRRSIL
ncbi:MAG: putative lipid II flippase FtsW [Clostridiales bacterium]|jgi:cell division protein FtsW|nr:putative lipid II flippase FtsW [Clostridiales bacterium]